MHSIQSSMILLKTQALASRRQSLAGCESIRDGSIFAWSTFNSRLSQKQKIANKDPKDQEKKHPFFQFRVQAQKHPFFDFEYKLMKTTLFFKKFANMLKKKDPFLREIWNDHAYTKSIQSDNTGTQVRLWYFVSPRRLFVPPWFPSSSYTPGS